ncbi:MAG: 6-bladed beta-propeller [Cytophagales bacterium]
MKYKKILDVFSTFFVILISLSTLASCKFEKKVEKVEIPIHQSINEFGDGTFLSNAFGIDVDSEFVYIADINNNRIVVVDTQFSLIRTIGSKGDGPGEFKHPVHVKTYQNYVYIYDASLKRMNKFSKSGLFEKIITLKFSPGISTPAAFDDSGFLLFATPTNSKPIVVLSDSGTLIKEFGEQLPDNDGKIYPLRNGRFVFSTGNHIVALCVALPFIEKYDINGNLLMRQDLSLQYEEIELMRKVAEKKYRNYDDKIKSQVTINLFLGAFLKKNFLYATFKREMNDDIFCEILQIDVNSLKIKKVICPKDREKRNVYFESIAKSEKAFYLGSNEIYKLYYEQ